MKIYWVGTCQGAGQVSTQVTELQCRCCCYSHHCRPGEPMSLSSPSVWSSATARPQPVPWVWLQQHSQRLSWGQEQNWTFKVLQRFVCHLIACICGFSPFLFRPPPGKLYPWQQKHGGFCLEQSFKALEPMEPVWGCHSLQRLLLGFQTP